MEREITTIKHQNLYPPSVLKWCKTNGFAFDKKKNLPQGKIMTHTMFDSCATGIGILAIPDEFRAEFNEEYANSWKEMDALYYNEVTTSGRCSKLIIDLDILLEGDVVETPQMFDPVVECIYNDLVASKSLDSQCTSKIVVLSSGKTLIKDSDPEQPQQQVKSKLGLHIIFPNIALTSEMSQQIRKYLYPLLQSRFGDHLFGCKLVEPWETIYDLAVAKDLRGRMIGSRKLKTSKLNPHLYHTKLGSPCMCPVPDNYNPMRGPKFECICYKGKLRDCGRQFLIEVVMIDGKRDEELTTQYRNNHLIATTNASIYCPEGAESVVFEEGGLINNISITDPSKKRKRPVNIDPAHEDAIRGYLNCVWKTYAESGYIIDSAGRSSIHIKFNSTRCPNAKNQHHTTSTTHITLTRKGVIHRCYSVKPDVRKFCKCSEFERISLLPPVLSHLLFEVPKPVKVAHQLYEQYG